MHCAINRDPSSLGGFRELPKDDRITSTIRSLIQSGADVNRKYERRNANLIRDELPRLPLPTAKILLQAGLLCDRKTLQALAGHTTPPDLLKAEIFKEVREHNVFEVDREYWQSLTRGLVDTTKNLSAPPHDSAGPDLSADSVPGRSNRPGEEQSDTNTAIKDGCSSTELLHAATAGDLDLVASLTSAGADWNHRDEKGQSSLHIAAKFGYVAIYEHLSSFIQDHSSIVDTLGRTPLHLAASSGAAGVVATIYAESPRSAMLGALDHLGYSP